MEGNPSHMGTEVSQKRLCDSLYKHQHGPMLSGSALINRSPPKRTAAATFPVPGTERVHGSHRHREKQLPGVCSGSPLCTTVLPDSLGQKAGASTARGDGLCACVPCWQHRPCGKWALLSGPRCGSETDFPVIFLIQLQLPAVTFFPPGLRSAADEGGAVCKGPGAPRALGAHQHPPLGLL